jgi:hypothetical protein
MFICIRRGRTYEIFRQRALHKLSGPKKKGFGFALKKSGIKHYWLTCWLPTALPTYHLIFSFLFVPFYACRANFNCYVIIGNGGGRTHMGSLHLIDKMLIRTQTSEREQQMVFNLIIHYFVGHSKKYQLYLTLSLTN